MVTADALADAYETCTEGCGMLDRSELGKLLLTGPDARTFLDGQVSNAIAELPKGEGRYATLLTNKGRMLGDLRVIHTDEGLLLLCERVALQALFDQVRRGLIGWRTELHKRTLELGLLSLVGPRADAVAEAAGLPIPSAAEHAVSRDVIRTDVGLDVVAAASDVAALRAVLIEAGAVEVSEAAAEVVRVERGRPRYGIDLDADVMPEEAGIVDRAVSFTKGCYVGQETVARLHWKGKPNRHLRGLRLSAPAAPGDAVHGAEREVGHLGSAVISPRRGAIALALLRREISPGDHVAIGNAGTDGEVVELPFA